MTARRARPARPSRTSGLRLPLALLRLGVRQLGRLALDPNLPWEVQRQRLGRLMGASPVPRGTTVTQSVMNGVRTEVVAAGRSRPSAPSSTFTVAATAWARPSRRGSGPHA
jgi:hypothetical protein